MSEFETRPQFNDFVSEPNSQNSGSIDGRMADFVRDMLDEYKQSKQPQRQAQEDRTSGPTASESVAAAVLRMTLPGPLGLAADMARTAHEDTFGRTRSHG